MSQLKDKIPSAWLARCRTDEEREDMKSYILNNRKLFDELEHILTREERSIERGEVDYADSTWAFKTAHYNGMREMISRIRLLIP
jgi:hypothetical protein